MKNATVIFRFLSLIMLVLIWGYTIIHFKTLPEIIPTHFGLDGKADGFGNRNMVWFESSIATGLFLLLFYVGKNTDSVLLNIPDSMRKNKNLAQFFASIILFIIMMIFADISYESFQVALGNQKIVSHVIFLLLGLLFLTILGFLVYSNLVKEKNGV